MKYCDQCGEKINENARFCQICGAQVITQQEEIVPANQSVHIQNISTDMHVDLAEYLKRCMLLEKNIYIEEQLINKIKKKVANLGHPNHYDKPRQPNHAEFSFESGDGSLFGFGATVGGIIGLFAGGWLAGALIGGCALLGFFLIMRAISVSDHNTQADANYRQQMRNYDMAIVEDKKRVQQELDEKARLLEIIRMTEDKKHEIQQALETFYGVDILFPKYRNLIAVCSLYEYFISGRYSELTGPDGAYNRYETEIRLDRIITKLDVIINKLDAIKANQYMLYDALQEGNQLTKRLLEESVRQSKLAEKTVENTALAAHYSEITANNAEACAWIGIANHIELKRLNHNISENA